MKHLKKFESFEETKRIERTPRPNKKDKEKRCLGQCDRKVVLKDGKPAIYCAGCDRYIKSI